MVVGVGVRTGPYTSKQCNIKYVNAIESKLPETSRSLRLHRVTTCVHFWVMIEDIALAMQAARGASVYIPLLQRTGITAAVQAAKLPHPKLPKLRSQIRLPGLRFYFSPARVRRIMRIMRFALPSEASCLCNTSW